MKLLAALVALASSLPAFAEGVQGTSDGIEISFAMQRPVLVLHEPVVVEFTIQNRRSEVVELNLGGNYVGFFRVRLFRPDGQRTGDLAPFHRGGIAALGRVSLAPNETFSHQLVFDTSMGLDQQGEYLAEIWIDAVLPFRTGSGVVLEPPMPRQVLFRIESRNEVWLGGACNEAANTILAAQYGTELSAFMKAVRYLEQLVDPAAVPCLLRVIEAVRQGDDALYGTLARIGTPEASAALQRLEASPDETKASRARARLRELATGRPLFVN